MNQMQLTVLAAVIIINRLHPDLQLHRFPVEGMSLRPITDTSDPKIKYSLWKVSFSSGSVVIDFFVIYDHNAKIAPVCFMSKNDEPILEISTVSTIPVNVKSDHPSHKVDISQQSGRVPSCALSHLHLLNNSIKGNLTAA